MDSPTANLGHIGGKSRRVLNRLVTIFQNRVELLMVEVQEERETIVRVVLLALGAAVFGLLAGVALTVMVVLVFWDKSPILALLVLTMIYAGCGVGLYIALARLQRDWQTLPGTIEQLQKDCECLEQNLE